MNSAILIEESYRESKDNNTNLFIVLLDAKAAFDTVIHSHMMRKAFLAGINDGHWELIKDLHENAKSAIKWDGKISQPFNVNQGVRQGGILSTNLYKVYINQLLNMYETIGAGYKIGNISVNSTACADDIALIGEKPDQTQLLINTAYDYAHMEGYELQPTKSVVLNISHKQQKKEYIKTTFTMGHQDMRSVESSTHLGIIRTTSLKGNMTANVEENIKKARRSAYSLLGAGFHGHNGLDIETMIHLYKIYISPVLLYGLELILPTTTTLALVENFQKKILKQILSLPTSVADVTIYILTGILPIEAQLHIRALGLFNNICNQPDDSIEKSLARRQLLLKNDQSSSWFVAIRHMLRKYDLQEAIWHLNNPAKKSTWAANIKRTIHSYWHQAIMELLPLYKGLSYITAGNLEKGKIHPLLSINCHSAIDTARLPVKLKLLTGSYILQSKRIRMYKDETDPKCLLCTKEDETIEHFILKCERLSKQRNAILSELVAVLDSLEIRFSQLSANEKLQIILDITSATKTRKISPASVANVERLTRRLVHQLHIARFKIVCG